MTFPELLSFALLLTAVYLALRPLRVRLEHWLAFKIGKRKPGDHKPVIDIKDYKKDS